MNWTDGGSGKKDHVHGRISFNGFSYVRAHAVRLSFNIMITHSVSVSMWTVGRVLP
mgnify:CR=1 FL=1